MHSPTKAMTGSAMTLHSPTKAMTGSEKNPLSATKLLAGSVMIRHSLADAILSATAMSRPSPPVFFQPIAPSPKPSPDEDIQPTPPPPDPSTLETIQHAAGDGKERLITRPNWNEYFMAMAKVASTRSTCSSRPVGCVIVRDNRILVTGYNGAPPGEPHCTDRSSNGTLYCARRDMGILDRDKLDHCRSLHAEANALELADRLKLGDLLKGATIYSTLSPCIRCIKNLAAHGISRVYFEILYNSVDIARDREWEELARRKFEIFEQVSISKDSLDKLLLTILRPTSRRLLSSW
ncbi:MAG: dCMP deaminase family protein [Deltaproteobacteria bacterium]|nr:dCMP deaminase family protein [Deltaproteobacteria bacterium]